MADPIWTITGALATPRRSHTATLLTDGKVLVAGGANAEHPFLASAELYDPATGEWTSVGALHVGRADHTATLLPGGRVLVAGGLSESASINAAELYNPATQQWTPTGKLGDARRSHTATLLRTGLVLVVGGTDASDFPDRLASAELFDPATGVWTPAGSLTLNRGRTAHTATLLQDGMVLVVGGQTFGPFMAEGAELYDPASGNWTATGDPSTVRVDHSATLLPNGKVLVAAGDKSNALADELDSAELFEPASRSFTETGGLNIARNRHTATLLQTGQVLIAGGFKDIVTGEVTNPSTLRGSELYDPVTGQWSNTAEMNGARGEHSAVLLADGTVVVACGSRKGPGSSVPLNDGELFGSADRR